MEIVGPLWVAAKCLWSCSSKHTAYICDLEDNLDLLKRQQSELQDIYGDVKGRVEQVENTGHMQRTNQVAAWLKRVDDTIEKEIKPILEQGVEEIQNKCLGTSCPKNYVSTYKFGKKADDMLKGTKKLLDKGEKFTKDEVANKLPRTIADEFPVGKTVGMDTMLEKVWHSIEDKNVKMIGLYGMGGVGKTTLLKRINNELANTLHDFSLVIWVVVSKDYSIEKIRDVIRKRLEIGDDIWNKRSDEEKVAEIYKVLKQKKFIMLLDDIWEHLNLQEFLGVPFLGENNSKVLFTTRFENVCREMKAQKKFEVQCLTNKEAFELFCMNAGEEACNPKFPKQVEKIVLECKGLPLALVIVGRAMAGFTSIEAWNHVVNQMESYPSKFLDVKKVFSILKVSYDKLRDDTHRKCFLYCALFPEDSEIGVEKLIDLWVGEGFLDDGSSRKIYDMYDCGKFVIENLKSACVLESVDDISPVLKVKMHDVVRDMALWILRDEDRNENKVLVQTEASTPHEYLEFIERIVITHPIRSRWMVPACPNLQTVILIGELGKIDFSNSQCLSSLKVLDLSTDRWGVFIELTAEIGQLIHLEFLNLSGLNLKGSFPIELKNLKSLKTLLMEDLDSGFEIIPSPEVISSLEGLKVFRFTPRLLKRLGSGINEEEALLEKLESLPNLEELCIWLKSATAMEKLIGSTKLQRRLRKLTLEDFNIPMDWDSFWAFMSKIEHLEFFHLEFIHLEDTISIIKEDPSNNNIARDGFSKLHRLQIWKCNSIIHLTWLKYAPFLEYLDVTFCDSIHQVINEPEAPQDTFSRLLFLELKGLPNLTTIHKRDLSFPSLKSITIYGCPKLKKLPFSSNFATHNKLREFLIYDKEWWAGLEWEDPALKETLDSKIFHSNPLKKSIAEWMHIRQDGLEREWRVEQEWRMLAEWMHTRQGGRIAEKKISLVEEVGSTSEMPPEIEIDASKKV